MDEGRNTWLAAAKSALAPKEQAALGEAGPGESVVDHLIRIARLSRRAKARQAAMGALFPAARDRLPGVVELALDLLHDALVEPHRLYLSEPCWLGHHASWSA